MSRQCVFPARPYSAYIGIGAWAVAFLASPASADDCNELIRLGLYNISHSVSEHDALVTAYHHICDEQYSSSSTAASKAKGISFGFMGASLGWGGSKGSSLTQESWKKVCEDSNLRDELHSYSSTTTQQINAGTLSAWQSCIAMTSRGLKTEIRPTANFSGVSFDLYWTGSNTVRFQGIEQPDFGLADCTATSATGAKGAVVTQPVTAGTNFPLSTKVATFVCKRRMESMADGALWSDAARLTVKTTDGSFDIDLPAIGLRQVSIAEMGTLYQRIQGVERVSSSAMPILCLPPAWENKPYVPTSVLSGDIYKCNITVPSKGILALGMDAFIQGETCHFAIAIDGKVGTPAFTTVKGSSGESGHASTVESVGPGSHVISVRGSRWRGTDQCYLGGGGITGIFLPQM